MAKSTAKKKRIVKVEAVGQAHIHATFNNIIISSALLGSWSKVPKKNTPYAAQMAAQDCSKVAHEAGLRKVKVYVKGPGAGRESAIRTIHNSGIEVSEIIDVTPVPHNGCRPPKRRRV